MDERIPSLEGQGWVVNIVLSASVDIITEGNTIAETEEMIADAIFEYITFALENNLTKFLFKPASPEYWQKLLYGHYKKRLELDIYSR